MQPWHATLTRTLLAYLFFCWFSTSISFNLESLTLTKIKLIIILSKQKGEFYLFNNLANTLIVYKRARMLIQSALTDMDGNCDCRWWGWNESWVIHKLGISRKAYVRTAGTFNWLFSNDSVNWSMWAGA